MFNKKKRQINKSKQKASIKDISLRKAIISNLSNYDKEQLSIFLLAIKKSSSKIQDIDITMVSANTYYIVCYL